MSKPPLIMLMDGRAPMPRREAQKEKERRKKKERKEKKQRWKNNDTEISREGKEMGGAEGLPFSHSLWASFAGKRGERASVIRKGMISCLYFVNLDEGVHHTCSFPSLPPLLKFIRASIYRWWNKRNTNIDLSKVRRKWCEWAMRERTIGHVCSREVWKRRGCGLSNEARCRKIWNKRAVVFVGGQR